MYYGCEDGRGFYWSSSLQALCDTPIAGITGGVCLHGFFMKDDLWVNTLESALRHDRRGRASPRYELCRSNPCANPSYSSDDIPIYVPAEPTKHVLNNFPKKSLPCHITQNDVS